MHRCSRSVVAMARSRPGWPSMLLPMDMSLPWISIFRSSMMSMFRASSFARATSSRRQSIRAVFDLVTARAVLHHVTDAKAAIANLVASLRPGGAILLIEPDFLPVTIAEPPEVRAFWSGWLAWSRDRGIDYDIGRTLAPRLAALGIKHISGTAETAIYKGTSLWAEYWIETVKELREDLMSSGNLDNA